MNIYQNKTQLAQTFGISRPTVYTLLNEIRTQIQLGRYSEMSIIGGEGGERERVNAAVFADYMKYRTRLRDGNARKYVPNYEKGIF